MARLAPLHLLLLWLAAFELGARDSRRPDVLFIAVDDLRDWISPLDGYEGKLHTPSFERLAAMGTNFANAHTASPVCCPSRAAALSGKLPSSTGIYSNQHWWKPNLPHLVTIPGHFKGNGYRVVGSGKIFHHTAGNNPPEVWHEFMRHPFEDNAWIRGGPLYPYTMRTPVPEGFPYAGIKTYSDEADWGVLPDRKEEEYDDARCTQFVVDELLADQRGPRFTALGLFHPHMPWYTPQTDAVLYPEKEIRLPETLEDDLDDVPEAGRKLALRKNDDLVRIRKAGKWRTAVRQYLASITFADRQLGQVLDALQKSGRADSTVIVLWSDHGWHLGEKEHWHKRTLWEVSTRIPFFVVVPGRGKPGQRCDRPVSTIDLLPTLIEACGLPAVNGLDGRSLLPLLDDPDRSWKFPAVTVDENRHVAVRGDRYRYIRYADGSEELYDHEQDPSEWRNRAGDAELADVVESLERAVPSSFAKPARTKKVWDFDPRTYRWTDRKSGVVIEGGGMQP